MSHAGWPARCAPRPLRGKDRHRHRGRHRGLRRLAARAAARPGSTSASAGSIATCSASAIATPSRCGTAPPRRRALRRGAQRRLLRREHVLLRARCLEDGARLSRARGSSHGGFRCSTRSSSPTILRQFGTVELNRDEFHRLLEKALDVEADFHALPLDAPPDEILAIIEDAHARR